MFITYFSKDGGIRIRNKKAEVSYKNIRGEYTHNDLKGTFILNMTDGDSRFFRRKIKYEAFLDKTSRLEKYYAEYYQISP